MLRVVISSVALRHPSCYIIFVSVGATFPRYRCGGVLYAPLLLGLLAYVFGVRWAIPTETRCCYSYTIYIMYS